MKYLIRFITSNAAGSVEYNDRIVDAPVITIGRATDQTLHLRDKRVRLQHAKLESRSETQPGTQPGTVHLTTSSLSGVTVNGRSQRDAQLAVGDVVEIGSNILRVIEPEDGADFALSFELSSDASTDHFVADWSARAEGLRGWSKRRLSWTIAGIVLLATLVLPSLDLISKSVLQAGPIHAVHASIGAECSNCHADLFARVPDTACVECHTVALHVVSSNDIVLGEARCASCHLEHNEPPQLVNQHQALCADCHAAPPTDAALENAADFLDSHPEFGISLSQATQPSNLRFDHAVHLDASGIVTPGGRRVVECAECHIPEPGGARMLPISMVDHCSGCHTLAFDPDDPTREVPHGDPAAVVQTLIEYYSARLLGADPDEVEQRVRRPGQALSRTDRDRAAAEARVQALKVAEDLFERRACVNCHEVSKQDDNGDVPWDVVPVTLSDSFLPHANFSHAAHQTEVTSCESCHNAGASSSADDLLIPDIDNCRGCHGSGIASRNSAEQTPSTCVLCHSFHFDSKGTYP